MLVYHSVEKSITIALIRIAIADNSKTTVKIFRNIIFELLLSAKHVFVSNNTVFGERQAPS